MILSYDNASKEWTHEAGADETISFGFNKQTIPYSKKPEAGIHIPMNVLNGQAGPLIGILAAMNKRRILTGNGQLFQKLQSEVMKRNGLTIVFTPETVFKDTVTGFIFIPQEQKWQLVTTPLPHLVYNRVPFRKAEEQPSFQDAANYFIAKEIPFFNPAFINKYKLYTLFKKHSLLKELVPDTILITSREQLALFLNEHRRIYIKPSSASKGIGIIRLRVRNGKIDFASHTHQHSYHSFEDFWERNATHLLNHEHIAQKEIKSAEINGSRFDFRVHAHDGKYGYEVTGIGIRQSNKQELTTHLPHGGIILPYDHIQNESHDNFFKDMVKEIGSMLTEKFGYFGEFSIDAGLSADGHYVIYEVNSKPMSFDEDHIERKRIIALADLFFRKTGF